MSLIIAQKYSKALLEVAQESQQLEAVLAEVAAFDQVIQSTDLQAFLVDVAYSDDKKHQVIESLQNASSDIFKNFLTILVKNQRMALLPVIIKEIRHQADSLFKISDVDVTSASALSDAQLSKLETTIKITVHGWINYDVKFFFIIINFNDFIFYYFIFV